MRKYKKPGIPSDMAIEFQKKMVYAMRITDIEVKTLAKACDLATSTVDWILRRPDHRVTMIQYLALCNAMISICVPKINAYYGTCEFIDDVDLDNNFRGYIITRQTVDELMQSYSKWVKGAGIDE